MFVVISDFWCTKVLIFDSEGANAGQPVQLFSGLRRIIYGQKTSDMTGELQNSFFCPPANN
jgi:hypothetical protein